MTQRIEADVAIIGGGVIGLACAYELVRRGQRVVVLERERAGSGAGAVAAGMLAPVSEVETEEPAFVDLALESCGLYREWIDAIEGDGGLGCGYREEGSLLLALHRDHELELERLMGMQRRRGLESERLTRSQVLEKEPYVAPRVVSGLYVPGDRQVNPRRLTQALAAAIRARGGTVVEGEAAAPVYEGGVAVGAASEGVEVRAEATVIAAGVWSAEVWPNTRASMPPDSSGGGAEMPAGSAASPASSSSAGGFAVPPDESGGIGRSGALPARELSGDGQPRDSAGRLAVPPDESGGIGQSGAAGPLPMRPVKGQILRLRGPRIIEHVVRTPDVYLVPREDGELVVGATSEEQGFDTTITTWAVMDLLRDAWRILPGVAELELAETSAGLRPALRDHLPAIGATAVEGLFVATGHYRHGVLLAPVTAKLLAGAVLDGVSVPAAFDPSRLRAPATSGAA